MGSITILLHALLMFCGGLTAVLVALVIYGNALDSRADEEIYLNKTAEAMLGGEQRTLATEMHKLARAIMIVAIVTGVSLLAAASLWVYIGLFRS